jgi:DNA-binding response OmpR family regulator
MMYRKRVTGAVRNRKRVLVVEDDPWVRGFLRDVLSDEGYDVLDAADGRTGLRLVEQHSPDIMLLDIAMPEFTGVDVLYHLRSRRRTRNLPVVVVSAFPRVLPEIDTTSVACILPKPVNVGKLLDAVRDALGPDADMEASGALLLVK